MLSGCIRKEKGGGGEVGRWGGGGEAENFVVGELSAGPDSLFSESNADGVTPTIPHQRLSE